MDSDSGKLVSYIPFTPVTIYKPEEESMDSDSGKLIFSHTPYSCNNLYKTGEESMDSKSGELIFSHTPYSCNNLYKAEEESMDSDSGKLVSHIPLTPVIIYTKLWKNQWTLTVVSWFLTYPLLL